MRLRIKKIKRGVFTVEAAIVVPMVTFMTAALIGFIFYMHDNCVSSAAAYEAEFYAAQKQVNDDEDEAEKRLNERLEQRKNETFLGFGDYRYEAAAGSDIYTVNIEGEILPEVFKGLFKRSKKISIDKTDPVFVKRLMWTGGKIIGD